MEHKTSKAMHHFRSTFPHLAVLGLTSLLLVFSGCKKDDDDNPTPSAPVNEEELITSLYLWLVPTGGGDTAIFSFVDLDGDGGNAPVIMGDTLTAGTDYVGTILLLNESETPADTISNEVAAEDAEHQFFFSTTGGGLTWTGYGDTDGNGDPVGLLSSWTAGAAPGNGDLGVVLRHLPDKNAPGVSAGDITNAGGETDIEVTIPYVVQ